ncbi:MAG: hypothetical protein R2757_11045 [Draconibacterium sp.]
MLKILIINNAKPEILEFVKPIEKIITANGSTFITINYSETLEFNFEKVDGAVLTGSPQGDDIIEHHAPYFQWIKTFEKPILGICAGHHITGFLYGSEILRGKEPESGDYMINVLKPDPLFYRLEKMIIVKQMHNDSITLPETFDLLAKSSTCRNQLMKHKTKPIYTCQFHPEFYNHQLIFNFTDICRSETF